MTMIFFYFYDYLEFIVIYGTSLLHTVVHTDFIVKFTLGLPFEEDSS